MPWINVCKPKDQGGLGIKDMGTQNICLLLKLIHKLHCPTSSTWAQWVKERTSVITLTGEIHGDNWNTLRSILPLYRAITTVNIGDGKSASFWYDVWASEDAFDEYTRRCTAIVPSRRPLSVKCVHWSSKHTCFKTVRSGSK